VSNGRPAFAFFNPVFRIVALDGDVAHLLASQRSYAPNTRICASSWSTAGDKSASVSRR
jgi:hypothetical protein